MKLMRTSSSNPRSSVTRLAIQGFITSILTFDVSTYHQPQAQNHQIRGSPCRQQLYIPKVFCAHYSIIEKRRVRVKERTNQMVKLGCELLRLEQLGLLVGEARVLVSGRPLRKKKHGTASLSNRSDENNADQTKRALGRSGKRAL